MSGTSNPKQVVLIWNDFRDECISLVTLPQRRTGFGRLNGIAIEEKDEHRAWDSLAVLAGMDPLVIMGVDWTEDVLDSLWLYLGFERRIIGSPFGLADDPDLVGATVISLSMRPRMDNVQVRTVAHLRTVFDGPAKRLKPLAGGCDQASPGRESSQSRQAVDLPTG